MADESARLLGFAFASADLLFELEPGGEIGFTLGAAKQVTGYDISALTGASWDSFVHEDDQAVVKAFFASLQPGDRRGPIRVGLKPVGGRKLKRFAALSACRLPQLDPRISCALTVNALAPATVEAAGPHGLHNAEGLKAVTEAALKQSSQSGAELNMELVELAGLKRAADSLGHTEASAALAQVAAALRAESFDGASAAQLEDDRYAVVRSRTDSPERVAERLSRAMSDIGLPQIKPTMDTMELDPEGPGEGVRVLRVALDRFIAGGAAGMSGGSLGGLIKKTVAEASQFRARVAERRFSMVYQPVVSLHSGATDHYEALVRFGDNASPAASIQMAEGMDIIQDLDIAVVQAVLAELQKPGRGIMRFAANISARSLMQPAFISKLLDMIGVNDAARGRLIIEITESAGIDDLETADAIVRRLRKTGCKVSLDDFGAGAASFDHLRAIAVDEVKIDGRYIRELEGPGRSRAAVMVRSLADLCKELRVTSVAEMIETETTADLLRQIGVDFGQGYLFGRPSPEPRPASLRRGPAVSAPARRVGA